MLTSLFCLFVVTEETKFCGFLKRHALRCVCACACAREKPIKVWTNQIEVTKKKKFFLEPKETRYLDLSFHNKTRKKEKAITGFWQEVFCVTKGAPQCLKITEKVSHSTLRAKRAKVTFWVDKSSLKMAKLKKFKCDILSNFQTLCGLLLVFCNAFHAAWSTLACFFNAWSFFNFKAFIYDHFNL